MRQSNRLVAFKSLLVLVSSCLGACGTTRAYQGPAQPPASIALIRPAGEFDATARVLRVDDTGLGLFDNSVEVLPGKHVVTLSIAVSNGSTSTSTAQGDVELNTKAGSIYEAHGRTTGFFPMQHWFWIVDASTHSIVGGRKPAD